MSRKPVSTMASVTAGVPVFNMGHLMKRRIENLLEQRYANLKILISDNASTDETQEVCLHYARKYPQVTYRRQAVNLGQAKNFEFVLRNSRTEMFFLAAGDDWHAPSFAEKCAAELETYPECSVCSTGMRFVDDDQNPVDWPRKDGELWSTRQMTVEEKIRRFMFGASGFYLYSMIHLSRIDPRMMAMAKYTCFPYYEYPWVLGLTMTGSFCHTEATYLTYTLHNKRSLLPESEAAPLPVAGDQASNALLFLERYRAVVDELAPDKQAANRIKRQILIGALISSGGSLDWYKRAKPMKIWPQVLRLLAKHDFFGLCFLVSMQIFRIKPIRLLFRQRVY